MSKRNPKVKRLQLKTILHIVTGSVAAYKAADLTKALREEGAQVICVLTEGAKKFSTPLTFRAISGNEVYDDFFSSKTPFDVLHTELASKANLILVSPASANFIAKAAAGMADDLASCILLAAKCPILFVPAMNDIMYENPMTQRNIQTLAKAGYRFIGPVHGGLVCGRESIGHVASDQDILEVVSQSF